MSRPTLFSTGAGLRAACAVVTKESGQGGADRSAVAHLRLVVRVGSLMETDSQSGAAHFIEHLGFRATRHYEHGELIKAIESFGSSFGPDLNARTSLCETVWQLDLPLAGLKEGLSILREWAFHIRIADEDVEAERKVILEEWRTKQTASQRTKRRFWELAAPLIANRMPIGSKTFIETVTCEQLREFYEAHYTPENMAVVCVVDNPAKDHGQDILSEVQTLISEAFTEPERLFRSNIKRGISPSSLNQLRVGLVSTRQFACVVDPDLSTAAVSLEFLSDEYQPSPHDSFFRRDVVRRVLVSILDERFRERRLLGRVRRSASVSFGLAVHRPFVEMSGIRMELPPQCTAEECCEMLSMLAAEIAYALEDGFTHNEVEHAKAKWRRHFAEAKPSSLGLCEELALYFCLVENIPLLGHDEERARALLLLENSSASPTKLKRVHTLLDSIIKPEDVQQLCKEWLGSLSQDTSLDVLLCLFQGPSSPKGGLDETRMVEALTKGRQMYKSILMDPTALPSGESRYDEDALRFCIERDVEGLLYMAEENTFQRNVTMTVELLPAIDAQLVVFNDGIQKLTFCVRSPSKPNMAEGSGQVSFQAFALGGAKELLTPEEDCAFCLSGDALRESGLASLSPTELVRLESLTGARVYLQRHLHHRGIGGSAPAASLEILLGMLLLRVYYSFRCDTGVVERLKAKEKDSINAQMLSTVGDETQALREIAFGITEPLLRPHAISDVDKVDANMVMAVVKRAFQPLAQFTFCVVGQDVDLEVLRRFAARVLTLSKPVLTLEDKWKPAIAQIKRMNLQFSSNLKPHIINAGKTVTDKSQVYVILRPTDCLMPVEHFRKDFLLGVACEAIRSRLLARMRTNGGHVYSVNTDTSRVSLSPQARCFISFNCDTTKDETLADTCLKELHEAALWGFSVEEVSSVMTMTKSKLVRAGSTDSHWLFRMLDALKAIAMDADSGEQRTENLTDIVSQRSIKQLLGPSPDPNQQATAEWFGQELKMICRDMISNGSCVLIVRYRPQKL